MRVAHLVHDRYPDGQLFVNLRGTTATPLATGEALAQVLRAFGVATVPETERERVALYRTLVSERRVLLVLDDAADEAQVRDLAPASPACAVVITARRRLPDLDGVQHVAALQPLDRLAATDLFHRVVRRCGVDPGAEPEAVGRVVELCAGLPLALVIAGALRARDPGQTTADLAHRLAEQPLDGLMYGDRSVALSISAGLDRLDEDARTLFLGLGLLELPEFGLWTAAAILGRDSPQDATAALLRLASFSLIQPAGTGTRYRFHELTRDYARRRAESVFAAAGARRGILEQVYGTLLTLARRAHRDLYGGDYDIVHSAVPGWPSPQAVLAEVDRDPLAWFELERANIRAAVRQAANAGLTDLCWDLAVTTCEFYTLRGYFDDWAATHAVALDACRAAGNLRGEAVTIVMLGQPALAASNRAQVPGVAELTRAAAVFDQLGDQHGQAIALRTLAGALRRRGQFTQALASYTEALRLYQASADLVGRWQSLRCIGQTYLDLGSPEQAMDALAAAAEEANRADQPRLLAQTKYWIGRAHLAQGHWTDAAAAFQQVLDLVDTSDDLGRAYATHALGEAALRAGSLGKAENHLNGAASLVQASPVADVVLNGTVHQTLAELRRVQGDRIAQVEALRLAADCFACGDAPYSQAQALTALGEAYADQGAINQAQEAWTEALACYTHLDLPEAAEIQRRLSVLAG